MKITECSVLTTFDAGDYIITVGGEVDTYSAPRLRQALDDARRFGITGITVDLAEVTFMDSAGFGVLVAAHKRSADLGISLTVRNQRASVTPIMEITGLAASSWWRHPPMWRTP